MTHVTEGGQREITPVKVRDLPAFLAAVEPVARELMDGDVLAALAKHAGSVIEATAIGAGVDRAWLEDQTPDVLVELATRVLEANADFFVQRLLPAIEGAVERVNRALEAAGGQTGSGTGSSISPAPDSATGT